MSSARESLPFGKPPEMSVVVVSPGGVEGVSRTVHHLRRQTARQRLELVLVDCGGESLTAAGGEIDGFPALRLVDGRGLRSTGEAIAAGIRAASAPLVGCAEEHSFPEPGWAEAIIDAHSGPWAAVAGVLENANPATRTSWAALLSDFGPAVAPAEAGEAAELPGHHTTYKRATLQRYGDRLGRILEVEWVLHDDLRAAGERLFREPRAVSHHLNVSRLGSHLRAEFCGGRAFAANRARFRGWGVPRRLLWTAGSLLMPLVRFARARLDLRRCRPTSRRGVAAVLLLGLTANAAGQMLGYGLGPGRAAERRMANELNRQRYLRRNERVQLAALAPEDLPRLAAADAPDGLLQEA